MSLSAQLVKGAMYQSVFGYRLKMDPRDVLNYNPAKQDTHIKLTVQCNMENSMRYFFSIMLSVKMGSCSTLVYCYYTYSI